MISLFLINLLIILFSSNILTHPEPKIWICQGHILFPPFLPKQQILEYNWEQQLQPYQGKIIVGGAYSLVLQMSTFDSWDVLIESCTCNGISTFLKEGGCLLRNNFWLNKNEWRTETNKYIVVHFVAPQNLLKIDCQTLIVKCCGCCDNSCGRLPLLNSFPSLAITINCQYPLIPSSPPSPPILLPPPPSLSVLPPPSIGESECLMPYLWGNECLNNDDYTTPFWLIPLFLCLLALLLILCCLLAFCIFWAFRKRKEQGRIFPEGKKKEKEELPKTLPPIPLPPIPSTPSPSIPTNQKIFSTDQSAQTTPISPLSPIKTITESGIDFYDKKRRKQGINLNNNGFEHFERHKTIPIIKTTFPWIYKEEEEEEIIEREEEEEEWRMNDFGERFKYNNKLYNQQQSPPPPPYYREGNQKQQKYYENFNDITSNIKETNLDETEEYKQFIGNNNNNITKFGIEKQLNIEEEDLIKIRRTSPNGRNIKEIDQISRCHRTLF